jgi:hypothetical protein
MNPDDIQQSVDALKAQGAPDEAIHAFLTQHLGPPLPPQHDYHAEFKSGALQKRMAGANARDMENAAEDTDPSLHIGEALTATGANLAQGIPGAEAAQAGARSVVRGEPYTQALGEIRGSVKKIPGALGTAERIAGAAPLAKMLPGGVIAGGAALGAADAGLAADEESPSKRAFNTALGAATGAGTGALLKGAGNLAQRTGLTDVMSSGLSKLGGKAEQVAQAIGTSGAANKLLQVRQALLDPLQGSEQSAAKTMLDHVNATKAQAKALYDKATQDVTAVTSPRVRALSSDPIVQRALQWAGRVYESRGGAIPQEVVQAAVPAQPAIPKLLEGTVEAPPLLPTPPKPSLREALSQFDQRKGIVVARTEGTVEQQMARQALDRHLAEGSLPSPPPNVMAPIHTAALPAPRAAIPAQPEVTADLPNPEILALAKRSLRQLVERGIGGPGVSQEEALTVLPKLNALTDELHAASPDWKQADAFYAQAKNFETAYQKAFGAQQKVTSGGLDPSKLKSPDAINAWVGKAAGTPVGAARAAGQQAGAAGRLGDALKGAPLGEDIQSTLTGANGVFQPSPAAAGIRRMAFPSNGAAEEFTGLLGKTLRAGQEQSATFGPVSASLKKPWQLLTAQNPLATPKGTELRTTIAGQLADPQKAQVIKAILDRSTQGRELLDLIQRGGLAGANAAAISH